MRIVAAACAALVLGGCVELLPRTHAEVRSPWANFEEARTAFERVHPGRTTVSELRAAGIDPFVSPNVQLLSYSDVLLRFPIAGNLDRLDEGLSVCLRAGKTCTGYAINVRDTKRDRVGPFWPDALNFRREVEVTGWSFNALLLLVDDRVVYTLYGGQPKVSEHELAKQPLGPLQNLGDFVPMGNLIK
jgi:hypothetical protein